MFQISTGEVTAEISGGVTITGTLPKPTATQTIVTGTCRGQAGASTTLVTVSAGKTFYCTGATMNCGGVSSVMHIDSDGVEKLACTVPVNGSVSFTGGVLFTCASTKLVTVTSDQAGKTANVWGYEE